ncbi:hypothetical protein WOC76_07050 [Methylocystis sp. IM3]|uniref:hypothetical protein n=1 Tax=unclassified Methylocystis TaxID=2625913 RepID=UPI0030FC8DFF
MARFEYGPHPEKRQILRAIKKGEMTIPQAARRFELPIGGVVTMMRAAGMKIPEEFSKPRRERSPEPLSRASMGKLKDR